MTKKEESISICPNCASLNVHTDLGKEMIAWGGSTRWACDDCKHSAILFPSVDKSRIKSLRKKIKSRKLSIKQSNLKVGIPGVLVSRAILTYYFAIFGLFLIGGYLLEDSLLMSMGGGALILMVLPILLTRIIRGKSSNS